MRARLSASEPFLLLYDRFLGTLGRPRLVDSLRNDLFAQFATDCLAPRIDEHFVVICHHAEAAAQLYEVSGQALLDVGVL